MPVTYTYGQLQSQIAYELGQRVDLLSVPVMSAGTALALSPIQQAIQNAIAKWEREHFYFDEVEVLNTVSAPTIATVQGQEFYTSSTWAFLTNQVRIDKIWVLISNNRYTLNPRQEQYLADTSVNPSNTGQPVDYSYYAKTIRLYPIPDGNYPISVEGTQKITTLVNASDTNFWTTEAADLIKAEAKYDILANTLKQDDLANDQIALIYGNPSVPTHVGYLDALRSENVQRIAATKVRPTFF